MNNDAAKDKKKQGPIRFEAIIPVLVLSLITIIYFSFYFDHHLKKVIEYVGTETNGAEVNVGSINTSFLHGSFKLNGLQVTDVEHPAFNALEIGSVHFQYLWDALLRMKFVVVEASINNIQLRKPRSSPGRVLPPRPKNPGQMQKLQNEVMAQIKNKYSDNILGDAIAILGGESFKGQITEIRESLKSETRVQTMLSDVTNKKQFWDKKVKELSDTSKIKGLEKEIQSITKNKNLLQQAEGVQRLTELLKDVNAQYKNVQLAKNELQKELNTVGNYPKELQGLINEDVSTLKNKFAIPNLDLKEMAMHLFAGQFAGYIAKARKYQALAKQYISEKKAKERENEIVIHKRSEGINYQFPVTRGYPLFWLKRAAISSNGTAGSYTGKVSGELLNVTSSPKLIGKPIVLEMRGDFPKAMIMGARVLINADYTRVLPKQSAIVQIKSFQVPEKLFVNNDKLKFGFSRATASSSISVKLQNESIAMTWNSILTKPQFLVEAKNATTKELLGSLVNNIPIIKINGVANGSFEKINMHISSNLGDQLGAGFQRELGNKLASAQNKINSLVENKINRPKAELLAALSDSNKNNIQLGNLEEFYKKNEEKIQMEIAKAKTGGGFENLKDKGKDIFKNIKI